MKTSQEIMSILSELEEAFPVAEWKYNNCDLWPIIRLKLMFSNVPQKCNVPPPSRGKSVTKSVYNSLLLIISCINFLLLKIFNPRQLFINFEAYLFNLNGRYINRFYEKLILYFDLKKSSFNFNYVETVHRGKSKSTSFLKTIHVPLLMKFFSIWDKQVSKEMYIYDYSNFLKYIDSRYPFLDVKSISLKEISKSYFLIHPHILFWSRILKKIKPKIIFTVCYYVPQNFGMLYAADSLNIPVAEIQHGNVFNYPPYLFSKVPSKGYNTLPDYFINWDIKSSNQIKSWANKSSKHKTILMGNPWIKLWNDMDREDFISDNINSNFFKKSKRLILYTLVSEAEILPFHLRNLIKETQNVYQWCVRLHPRQIDEIESVKKIFLSNQITGIDIENTTKLPLPILLEKCDLHITSWSSVVLEAIEYGKISIVIHEEGIQRYGNLDSVTVFNGSLHRADLQQLVSDTLKLTSSPQLNNKFDLTGIAKII